MNLFDSPLLSLQEIISYFRCNTNINISETDFKQPNAKKCREIYSHIFETLTFGKSIEQVVQRMQATMRADTTNSRIFEEAFGQMAFTNCMGLVLHGCGYRNFVFKDVLHPTPKNLRRICSVFQNRQRWDSNRIEHFEETLERMKRAKDQSQSIRNRNVEIKQKLEEKAERHTSLDASVKKSQEEFEGVNSRTDELRRELEEGKRSKTDVKLKLAGLRTSKEELMQTISSRRQECDKLSSKIVQSPRKFQTEQERLQKEVNQMKMDRERKEQSLSENRQLLEQTMATEHFADRALKMVSEVLGDMEQENEVDQQLKKLSDEGRDVHEQLNSITAQDEDLIERLALRHEKRHQMASQMDIRNQSKWQQLIDLKNHRENREEALKTLKQETSSITKQTSTFKEKQEKIRQLVHEKESEDQKEKLGFMEEIQMLNQKRADGFSKLESVIGR